MKVRDEIRDKLMEIGIASITPLEALNILQVDNFLSPWLTFKIVCFKIQKWKKSIFQSCPYSLTISGVIMIKALFLIIFLTLFSIQPSGFFFLG